MREGMDTAKANAIDIGRIMEMIPHRYPMLLVDRVVDIVPGASAVGIKNITKAMCSFYIYFQHFFMICMIWAFSRSIPKL